MNAPEPSAAQPQAAALAQPGRASLPSAAPGAGALPESGSSPPPVPPTPAAPEKPKLTRAQKRLLSWNERNLKALRDEVNRRIREGNFEGVAEIGLALIEGAQGTLRLTASTRRLEFATYVLIVLTGVLAVLTYLLWSRGGL